LRKAEKSIEEEVDSSLSTAGSVGTSGTADTGNA